MRKKSSKVLWENIEALMLHHWKEINLYKLGKDSGIGTGGAARLKEQESGTRLPTIEKVAKLWKDVEPWMLIFPGLNPANLPVALTDSEKALYKRLKHAKAVADGEANHEPAKATAGR